MVRRIWARLRRRIERRLDASFHDLGDELGSSTNLSPDPGSLTGPAAEGRGGRGAREGS